ncbi:MAG TPA: hypothetical protein VGJ73_05495 [Verrucomicrobiae bacterium]|jgi:hypothetical protein
MGKEVEEDDDQRSKPAKKKSSDQAMPEDSDVSLKPPTRVHIFPKKSRPGGSSKPDNKKLQCSFLGTNTRNGSLLLTDRTVIMAAVQPPVIKIGRKFAIFMQRIEQGKKSLHEAAMKAEDLEALLQGLRRTRARLAENRQRVMTTRLSFFLLKVKL